MNGKQSAEYLIQREDVVRGLNKRIATLTEQRDRLLGEFKRIRDLSDLEMADGDTARDIADEMIAEVEKAAS